MTRDVSCVAPETPAVEIAFAIITGDAHEVAGALATARPASKPSKA
jgi:hypothetical protein